ncbi:hypothetical protein ACFSGI_14800 [Paenibacillus nicotianae]|uniref:Butirosin biosynthesis protein H, N-terminal n=1 Tax=Paenibacillus nicotianae TaxID=1526551 RepID=A0ABW4UYH7_9BACL
MIKSTTYSYTHDELSLARQSDQYDAQKILPLAKPFVKGYQYLGYALSVIMTHEESLPWVYHQFIQLSSPNYQWVDFYHPHDFSDYPWLETNETDCADLNAEQLIHTWIQLINEEKYLVMFIDEYYLSHTAFYQEEHYSHDIMLHGYNLEKGVFWASGYNRDFQYGEYSIPIEELLAAHFSFQESHKRLITIRYQQAPVHSPKVIAVVVALEGLIEQLQDYVDSRPSSWRRNDIQQASAHFYGMEIYNILQNSIQNFIDNRIKADIRAFHIWYEHKEAMEQRLLYLMQNVTGLSEIVDQHPDLMPSLKELTRKATIIRNLLLKYNRSHNIASLERASELLYTMRGEEEVALQTMLTILQQSIQPVSVLEQSRELKRRVVDRQLRKTVADRLIIFDQLEKLDHPNEWIEIMLIIDQQLWEQLAQTDSVRTDRLIVFWCELLQSKPWVASQYDTLRNVVERMQTVAQDEQVKAQLDYWHTTMTAIRSQ